MRRSCRNTKEMKFGKNQNTSEFYAAQYNPESNRVEVVDTDKSLDNLLTRHGVLADEETNSEE
jgi:hypothetical protein